jgi:hypothetical protein
MKSLGRLFVVTGICLFAVSAFASDVVVASAPNYATYLFAKSNASAPVTVSIPQYLTSPKEVTLQPGGVAVFPVTVTAGFGTITVPDSIEAFTRLDYDGATHSSYPLGPVTLEHSGHRAPIVNDGITGTYVSTLCKVPTPVTLTPRNGEGVAGSHEYFVCAPPATQYKLVQQLQAGSLDFSVGNLPFDDGSAWPPLYVIVTVGKPDRDAFVVPQR